MDTVEVVLVPYGLQISGNDEQIDLLVIFLFVELNHSVKCVKTAVAATGDGYCNGMRVSLRSAHGKKT